MVAAVFLKKPAPYLLPTPVESVSAPAVSNGSSARSPSKGVSGTAISMWGDSMTSGLSTTGSFSTSSTLFIGKSGENTSQLAALQGGVAWFGDIKTGVISGIGETKIDQVNIDALHSAKFAVLGFKDSWPVSISGVNGIITRSTNSLNGPANYVFSRSLNGTDVKIQNPVLIHPLLDPTDLRAVNLNSSIDANSQNTIIWLGRNGAGSSSGQSNAAVISLMIAKLTGGSSQKIMVLPPFNGGLEVRPFNQVDPLSEAFPKYYFDVRTLFVKQSKQWFMKNYKSEYEATWFSPCPLSTCQGKSLENSTNSDWDIAHNIPPRALRRDTIHLNKYGNELLKALLTAELTSRGWFN